jgi:hypothetical protein
MNTGIILIGLAVSIILISNFQISDSTLWDLIIEVNFEQNPLQVGENPVVFGSVVDHAGKPISDADIKIRLGENSILTTTDNLGVFIVEFLEFSETPGAYAVNVLATSGDKIGIKSSVFEVKGEISVSSVTEKMLSTDEAIRYLNSSIGDFENDPLGLILYNYYQDLQTKLIEEQSLQAELDRVEQLIDEQREIALQLTEEAIEEENPGAGTYSGWKYYRFIGNLDYTVKDIIVNQLNYTVTVFKQAQKAMEEVLANGGTRDEAMQAYYEKATITREVMESLTIINEIQNFTESGNYTNAEIESEGALFANATDNQIEKNSSSFILNVNGTNIDVGKTGTVIYLSINGTIVELIVNGTQIEQITNSSQN